MFSFVGLVNILKWIVGLYILAGVLFSLLNTFLAQVICTAQTVIYNIAEYKAYIDTMFPITIAVLKLIGLILLIKWIYQKVTSLSK